MGLAPDSPAGAPRDLGTAAAAYPLRDAGNPELYADLNGGELRLDHRRGHWLNGAGHWRVADKDGLPVRRAKELARERIRLAADIDDLDHRKNALKWGLDSESRMRIDATQALSRSERPLAEAGDMWDADP